MRPNSTSKSALPAPGRRQVDVHHILRGQVRRGRERRADALTRCQGEPGPPDDSRIMEKRLGCWGVCSWEVRLWSTVKAKFNYGRAGGQRPGIYGGAAGFQAPTLQVNSRTQAPSRRPMPGTAFFTTASRYALFPAHGRPLAKVCARSAPQRPRTSQAAEGCIASLVHHLLVGWPAQQQLDGAVPADLPLRVRGTSATAKCRRAPKPGLSAVRTAARAAQGPHPAPVRAQHHKLGM